MRTEIILLFLLGFIMACSTKPTSAELEAWKQEIRDAEKKFAVLALSEGTHKAFVAFAAPDAVLLRREDLIVGRVAIDSFYVKRSSTSLNWSPDFVDVSSAGDLGYTYGTYTYSYEDENGNPAESKGTFHTVWKRQPDGSWKFVWD